MRNERVVIIGAGIIGCLSAVEAKKKGFDVVVIDQSKIGSGSSWAAGGILFPLMPWEYPAAIYELCKPANHYYNILCKKLLQETGIDSEFHESGINIVNPTSTEEISIWCEQNNIEIQHKPINKLPSLYLKNIFQIRPPYLMKALAQYMKINNINFIKNKKIVNFKIKEERIQGGISSEGEIFKGEKFIITAGAWTYNILNNYKDKVFPVRGQMIQYPNTSPKIKNIIYEDGFYLIPRKDGVLIAGSTLEKVGFNSDENKGNIEQLKKKAESIIPELKYIEIENSWHGFRPGTSDNLPIIEKEEKYENLYINIGHHRYGITMAPYSAECIANLISS